MKEVVIIISILLIVFGSTMLIQDYLNKGTDKLVGKLVEIKKEVEGKNIGEEELKKKSEIIYKEWKDINESWSTIVLHEEIDLIETALIRMKSKIQIGNIEDSMEDIDTSIFLLKHIKEKEKTSLKNIF